MRRGVTLLEVLIAILVASVGLLGAIAVFPVAMSQAKKGQIADVSAVAGESAIAAFKAQGMNERPRWLAWDQTNQQQVQVPADFQESTSPYFGYSFCIDPMLFSHNAADDPANGAVWSYFPAVPQTAGLRMMRLNLTSGNPVVPLQPMNELQAAKWFSVEDELMYQRPEDDSLPAGQLFTTIDDNGTLKPARRQEEGRLTWFATLVPKIDILQSPIDAAGTARLGDEYVLSIVVCRNRASGEAMHVNDPANPEHPWNEWTAKILAADFHSAGIGGGEVTVTTNDPATDATFNKEEYLGLKSGQWVMLGRTIPGTAAAIQHYQWYRVSDAAETLAVGNRWSQEVSLVGGDWPADMMPSQIVNGQKTLGDGTNDECDVMIMPTVVHVYERTIRLSQ